MALRGERRRTWSGWEMRLDWALTAAVAVRRFSTTTDAGTAWRHACAHARSVVSPSAWLHVVMPQGTDWHDHVLQRPPAVCRMVDTVPAWPDLAHPCLRSTRARKEPSPITGHPLPGMLTQRGAAAPIRIAVPREAQGNITRIPSQYAPFILCDGEAHQR